MAIPKRWSAVPFVASAAILGPILYAAHRPDLPSYDNYETSGAFGDPGRPGLLVAAIGDSSITAPGVDHVDDAWIRRVAWSLTDRYFVQLRSFAVGGSKAVDVLTEQLPGALEMQPDLAIVSVAANDAIRAVSPRRFEAAVDEMVRRLCDTGARVVVVGVGDIGSIPRLPRYMRGYLTRRSAQFDGLSADVASRYPEAIKVDVRGDLSDAFWNDRRNFSGDQFHASSHGHEHFAHHVSMAVEASLSRRPHIGR